MGREGGKVEPGGIARYRVNVECGEHVGSLTVVVWSSWQACNRRCLYLDVCQFCGACGVGAVLGTVVRSAWRVWLVEEGRGGRLPRVPLAAGGR